MKNVNFWWAAPKTGWQAVETGSPLARPVMQLASPPFRAAPLASQQKIHVFNLAARPACQTSV